MRQRAKRKNSRPMEGVAFKHGVVCEEVEIGRWTISCSHCEGIHTQNSRDIQRGSHPRECPKFKPHNHSGLLRWDAMIRRIYGITLVEYEQMLAEQDGGCKICGRTETEEGRRLAIDHCHETKVVRGVLCGLCNQAIGMLNHDPKLLNKAVEYLTNARAR